MKIEMKFAEVDVESLNRVIGGGRIGRRIRRKLKWALEAVGEALEMNYGDGAAE